MTLEGSERATRTAMKLRWLSSTRWAAVTSITSWAWPPCWETARSIALPTSAIPGELGACEIAYKFPEIIQVLGSGKYFGLRWLIVVAVLVLLIAHLILTYTRFGRYVYMTGGNRDAAEYSGVNVKFIIGAVLVISAMLSGFAGMLGVAYFGSAQQNQFDTFLLDAIAAVVVGGTSLFGGRGGIGNTIIGLLVLGVLNNGLDHVNIDSFLKILIRGLILLIALIINVYAQKMRDSSAATE